MSEKVNDPIKPWFDAMEDMGDYIGIRFGRIPPGKTEPEWIYLPHSECDGIGGLADLLRRRGADIPVLPQMKHPSNPSWSWFFKTIPKYVAKRRRLKWGPLEPGPARPATAQPSSAVAWHVFDEAATEQMRKTCRAAKVTLNSYLLKHLSQAIRPSLENRAAPIPWMIPVNLRGKVVREKDTSNYSSYVGVKIREHDGVDEVHRNIYKALDKGEHWANWYCYTAGRAISPKLKKHLLITDKAMSEWFLGGFSNLGEWDPEKKWNQPDCQGAWLFSPPVLQIQLLGAGCITFQKRLGLVIQAHPELTTNPATTRKWMQNWVRELGR